MARPLRPRTVRPTRGATPRPLRRAVLRRGHDRCTYCGTHKNVGVDHVVPRVKGGPHTAGNLVSCCRRCNEKKADWDLDLFCMRLEREGKGVAAAIFARVEAARSTPVIL